jgi:hypothetical protein
MEWRCKCGWIELDDRWGERLPKPFLVKNLELLYEEEEVSCRQPRGLHGNVRWSPPARRPALDCAGRDDSADSGVAMEPAGRSVPHLGAWVVRVRLHRQCRRPRRRGGSHESRRPLHAALGRAAREGTIVPPAPPAAPP